MNSLRIDFLNTAATLTLVGSLAGLSTGCTAISQRRTVEIVTKPASTTLTSPREHPSDQTLQADIGLFERLRSRAEELPLSSAVRAEATAWLEGARTEYLSGNRNPWVYEAVAHTSKLLEQSLPSGTASDRERAAASLRGLDAWIAHIRATRGFRAALPVLERAEPLRAIAEAKIVALTKNDFHPGETSAPLADLQNRLAALYDHGVIPLQSYAWSKAQAWLDFAVDEDFARDRSRPVDEITKYAADLVRALEATPRLVSESLALACQTPSFIGRGDPRQVYPDLWEATLSAHASNLSKHLTEYAPRLASLAKLEVALLQAGYESGERGPRAARPYEQAARRIAATFSSAKP